MEKNKNIISIENTGRGSRSIPDTISQDQRYDEKDEVSNFDVTPDISMDRLYKLININLTINDSYDNFDVVLHRLLHSLEIITDSESTSLLFYDEQKEDLIFRYATGHTAHDIIGLRVPHQQGIAHSVANTKKGVIVNNAKEFGYYSGIDNVIEYKTKNLMAFPILDENGEVFGIVETCNKRKGEDYTKDDFLLLSIFCQQAELTIRHASQIDKLKQNISDLIDEVEGLMTPPIVFESKEMKNNMLFVERVTKSNAPVLIIGEAGTGKTLFARHIHKLSSRRSNPIIEICPDSEIRGRKTTAELMIEICGIKKNYKEGIKRDVRGALELVKNGTIVFNEISSFPIEIQKKITEILTYKNFSYVNSKKQYPLDLRVVFTSTKDLSVMLETGKLYDELYYLINTLTLRVSPINSRPEDIEAIAKYYIDLFIEQYHKPIKEVEPRIYPLFKKYSWQYNVHSILLILKYVVLTCTDDVLRASHVASCLYILMEDHHGGTMPPLESEADGELKVDTLSDAVRDFKASYIHRILLQHNWNHTKTAKKLDIQRSYLSRLVKEFDLNHKLATREKEE